MSGYRRYLSTISPVYFPYGKSDFRAIRRSKQFYADTTGFIPKLESIGEHLIFTRPPRWGKSLLQDMLRCYYDKNTTEQEFGELFSQLAIHNKPTPLARSFLVLPLDLTVGDSFDTLEQSLFNNINARITNFAKRYDLKGVHIVANDANASLISLALAVEDCGPLYLLIDEYDRFANKLMFENPEQYRAVVRKSPGSPLRSLLETVKAIKPTRTFITGITTIALADASGANSFLNVSLDPQLGSMLGFTKENVLCGLNVLPLTQTQSESAMALMQEYFNGYRFPSTHETPLFTAQQCLYFFMGLASGKFLHLLNNDHWRNLDSKVLVKIVTDPNTRISDNVFGVLGNTSITRADILSLASSKVPCSVASLNTTYRLADMLAPSGSSESDGHELMLDRSHAFMFSHGMVTLTSGLSGDAGTLVVPNKVARQDYLQKLDSKLGLRSFSIERLFQNLQPESVRDFFQDIINKIETAHDKNFSEGALQVMLESWLKAVQLLSPRYKIVVQATHPSPDSEADENTHKYSDILLIDQRSQVAVLIELARIGLQYVREGQTRMFREKEDLDRWHLSASEQTIAAMAFDELMGLRSAAYFGGPILTVREHLDNKKRQVIDYETRMKHCGYFIGRDGRVDIQGMTIHTFAMIQVGRRLIVEGVK